MCGGQAEGVLNALLTKKYLSHIRRGESQIFDINLFELLMLRRNGKLRLYHPYGVLIVSLLCLATNMSSRKAGLFA